MATNGLDGRTVLITGASRNMGKLAALTFAREGANLAICTSTKIAELNEVADEARALGAKVIAERCDITDPAQVAAFMGKVRQGLGRLDVVVNTAGYRCRTHLADTALEEWNKCMAVNLTGPMLVCQAAAPLMIERGWGRIINLSGIASYIGGHPAMAMVKLGIVGFTRSIARELGQHNITANCISPGGGTNTDFARPPRSIARQGEREDYVSLMVYLASEHAGFISGQCHMVDGGTYFQ